MPKGINAMILYKYTLDETHRLIQEPLNVEEKPISYVQTLPTGKRKYIKKSILDQIDSETDILYSLSDNKATAANLFVQLYSNRRDVYAHAVECMDNIIKVIIEKGRSNK